ncbi:hypothetical protein, partial [Desulfomicrobium apsheronum]|uniref:hypothetical protein n=1 Tax=Desulfomicrobium apsheronum TaxID=52560 RepID=UPI001C433DD1
RKSRFLHLALREAIFTRNLYFSMALFYGKVTNKIRNSNDIIYYFSKSFIFEKFGVLRGCGA